MNGNEIPDWLRYGGWNLTGMERVKGVVWLWMRRIKDHAFSRMLRRLLKKNASGLYEISSPSDEIIWDRQRIEFFFGYRTDRKHFFRSILAMMEIWKTEGDNAAILFTDRDGLETLCMGDNDYQDVNMSSVQCWRFLHKKRKAIRYGKLESVDEMVSKLNKATLVFSKEYSRERAIEVIRAAFDIAGFDYQGILEFSGDRTKIDMDWDFEALKPVS